jgi:hypothetical protein
LIQPGTVMYVKTTNEPVIVCGDAATAGEVEVMRPLQTEDGIQHLDEDWPLWALETEDENIRRTVARQKLGNKLMFDAENPDEIAQQMDLPFPPHKN